MIWEAPIELSLNFSSHFFKAVFKINKNSACLLLVKHKQAIKKSSQSRAMKIDIKLPKPSCFLILWLSVLINSAWSYQRRADFLMPPQYLGALSEYNTIRLKYGYKFNIIVLGQP